MAISQNKKIEFIKLRAEGKSLRAIAEALGIAYNTSLSLCKELEIEIRNQKVADYDEILSLYNLQKKSRLEVISKYIKRVNAEIDKRDLSKISTEKLFALQERLNRLLSEENKEAYYLHESDFLKRMDIKHYSRTYLD